MEASFPRGGASSRRSDADDDNKDSSDKKKDYSHRRHSSRDPHHSNERKKRSASASTTPDKGDVLFGTPSSTNNRDGPTNNKRAKRTPDKTAMSSGGSGTSHHSMLPLGGGGVVQHGQHGGNYVVEALSWNKLRKGMRALACVREVYGDLVVFSLPNLWTGYQTVGTASNKAGEPPSQQDLTRSVRVGQYLSVAIVSAVEETTRDGPKRRIRVDCRPSAVNLREGADGSGGDASTGSATIRGQVLSVEDHGLVVDLGFQRRGFLALDQIEGPYSLDDDEDDDDQDRGASDAAAGRRCLAVGRILDFFALKTPISGTGIVPLSLPTEAKLAKTITRSFSALSAIQPGQLVRCQIESLLSNGLAVTFAKGVYRGAIESSHLGGYWTSAGGDSQHDHSFAPWKGLFKLHAPLVARVLAVDPVTKIVRLTVQPHLLALRQPSPPLPDVGAVVPQATVVRLDPGVGALLAMPAPADNEDGADDNNSNGAAGVTAIARKLNPDLFQDEDYRRAAQAQAVYVHISKAMDDDDSGGGESENGNKANKKKKYNTAAGTANNKTKLDTGTFNKHFRESTRHDVRILSTSNVLDGIATGATARSILEAHVLTHADLRPGAIYRGVTVVAHVHKGSGHDAASSSPTTGGVLVHLGMGVRGLVPAVHLFDTSSAAAASGGSEYRDRVAKSMYAVGSKVDVRVLSSNPREKRCTLTAKKSLLKAKTETVLATYESAKVGQRATGFVSKVDARGGVSVTFFNGVYGRVTAKSLLVELGIANALEDGNYSVGDVVECRVVNVKRKLKSRPRYSQEEDDDDDDMDVDGEGDEAKRSQNYYWELTLSLRTNPDEDDDNNMEGEENGGNTSSGAAVTKLHIKAGGILPLRSIRIVELVPGRDKEKGGGYVPGYALVSVKSKYLFSEAELAKAPPYIDCKLPYDQILDEYGAADIESAAALDDRAGQLLTVGKKINRKGLILTDPAKLSSEYTSGTGKLTVVSVRPKLVEVAEVQQKRDAAGTDSSSDDAILPAPDAHLYVGANLLGYVVQLDPRHGAFVRFLNGLTGLVPKLQGGLELLMFSTVTTRVAALDVTTRPMKILLALGGGSGSTKLSSKSPKNGIETVETSLDVGDSIEEVEVLSIDFHRATVKILDRNLIRGKYRARLHCSMAEGKPLPKPLNLTKGVPTGQVISKYHPFYGLKIGSKLASVRVAAKDVREGTVYLDLSNRKVASTDTKPTTIQSPVFLENASELSPGQKVSGIVTSIDSKKGGLWLQVSPGVSGFVPGLELSEDAKILNNLAWHFAPGSCLECVVLDRDDWRKTRTKYSPPHHKKDETTSNVPFFSFLQSSNNPAKKSKPKRGDIIVGRIGRSLPPMLAPALMLELRDGYIGRCCICELEDPDEWTNMPVGHVESSRNNKTKGAKPQSEKDGLDIDNTRATEAENAESTSPYPNGMFVYCRVLESIPSKPVVDVSLRKSRIEGDLEDDESPEVGELAHAFVVSTNKKGCFLRLGRKIEGRTIIKELCDGFLPDPAASFPMGRLVVGKVKAARDQKKKAASYTFAKVVDIDMRESVLDSPDKLAFAEIVIGQKYKGTVTRIEEYGVFVQVQHSDVSGLVHKSECSDKYVKKMSDLYDPGDLVKILVLKKDDSKKQLGFSMKASHFENDEDSDDDSVDDDSENEEEASNAEMKPVEHADDLDSEDENLVSKLAAKILGEEGGSSGSGSGSDDSEAESGSDEDSSDDDANGDNAGKAGSKKGDTMDTNVGFDWGGLPTGPKPVTADSEEDEDSSSDEDAPHKASHKSRRKQAQRLREEQEIARRETALADGTADENPETAADFERLLAANPDSSEIWIKYMAFHLSLADIQAARGVAVRAYERISFRQEGERLNIWCALLTLELKYGTETDFQSTIDRACQHNNPKHVYLRVCEMLEKEYSESSPDAAKVDEIYSKMCKKFKDKKKVWIAHVEYLLRSNRHEEAHALSKRALLSLPPYKHVETMTKVAQLVFEYGTPEKARTLFDGLLLKYPKRLDLFFVYVDKEVKHGDAEVARALFEHQVAPSSTSNTDGGSKLKLSEKQMKSLFKKWYSLEEQHGTDETQDRVKAAARAYVEQSMV